MKKNPAFFLVTAMYFVSLTVEAQIASNAELVSLKVADQADRNGKDIDWSIVGPNDKARAARVLVLLNDGELKTAEDYYNAALIYQHGSSPDDFKLAFSLATISSRLTPSNPAPKWLAAAAWDRYMVWKNLPQWYGNQSQLSKETGKRVLYPILPSAVSDAEREAANVPV